MVVTTYGTVVHEFRASGVESMTLPGGATAMGPYRARGARGALFGLWWDRVVLDEAHVIKNRATQSAQACACLAATHRWALTGTPIQNSLLDLFSLVHFLRHEPWCAALWWRRVITTPHESGDPDALVRVREYVVRRLVLRRMAEAHLAASLPQKHVSLVWVDLGAEERLFYDALFKRSKIQFEGLVKSVSWGGSRRPRARPPDACVRCVCPLGVAPCRGRWWPTTPPCGRCCCAYARCATTRCSRSGWVA